MIKGYVLATFLKLHDLSDKTQSGRSRGFGFITMATVDDAARCIKEMNGVVRLRFL
jgi:RNA recognition motif-containing protein